MNKTFQNKTVIISKLLEFGFTSFGNTYSYSENIMNGDFVVNIEIKEPNIIKTQIKECETGEIYTLHLTNSNGTFVGQIREEYNKLLNKIAQNCFENHIFKYQYTYDVINYVKNKYGDSVEYLWEKFPDNAIARRKDNKKWYLAILTVKKNKLGFDSDKKVEIIDIRAKSEDLPKLIAHDNIFPGYHMNKKHWISIILDGSMNIDEIYKRIDESYIIAKNK